MNRRGMLGAILGAGFAPAIIGSGILMPISKKIVAAPLYVPAGLDVRGVISASSLGGSAMDRVNVQRLVALIKKEMSDAIERARHDPWSSYNFAAAVDKLIPENSGVHVTHSITNGRLHTAVKSLTHTGNLYVTVS
jgi:hypothetical protein